MQLSVFNVVDGVKLKWCAISCTTTEIQYSFLAPHYGRFCLWISEIHRLFTHLSGIINVSCWKCYILEILLFLLLCVTVWVFAISFIVHIFQKHWFLGSFNTKALLPGTILCLLWYVFTARCYASAVLAMALCPSVRPSVCLLSVRHKSVFY